MTFIICFYYVLYESPEIVHIPATILSKRISTFRNVKFSTLYTYRDKIEIALKLLTKIYQLAIYLHSYYDKYVNSTMLYRVVIFFLCHFLQILKVLS